MFRWMKDENYHKEPQAYDSVVEGLKKLYKTKLLPLEEHHKFHDFHSPQLDDSDFDAKPMVLLVGQYSTGKTTFIRHLLGQEFPGLRIGPEPTTDGFIAVMHGDNERSIPGNALVVDKTKQFRKLTKFGNAFLNRLQCAEVDNMVLKSISIIDTPGILSGEKQRIDRGYDFTGILEWFAERVDRIILLFDAHKLDISDEFRRSIEAIKGYDDKIRIVLNKADGIDQQQLMRVYGALMWSLGKVLQTPEVVRVYIGSFWDEPLVHDANRRLFEMEEHDLFKDLGGLPRNATLRKLNDIIKRARLAKVHAYIIDSLKKEMPSVFGKENKKKELIKNLGDVYASLQREHNISPGDFPNIARMQEQLLHQDFSKFHSLNKKYMTVVEQFLSDDIARLMAMIPNEEASCVETSKIKGGAFQNMEENTPFGLNTFRGTDYGRDEGRWVVEDIKNKFDVVFDTLDPIDGKISGAKARQEMVKSRLPNSILAKIWKLADVDRDGMLDADEWALANYLIKLKLDDNEPLPDVLPDHLMPPAKKGFTP